MRAIQATHRRRGLAAGLVMTSVVALSILGGGTALAANPDWVGGYGTDRTVTPQPTSGASSTFVSAGQQVGFFVDHSSPGPRPDAWCNECEQWHAIIRVQLTPTG